MISTFDVTQEDETTFLVRYYNRYDCNIKKRTEIIKWLEEIENIPITTESWCDGFNQNHSNFRIKFYRNKKQALMFKMAWM